MNRENLYSSPIFTMDDGGESGSGAKDLSRNKGIAAVMCSALCFSLMSLMTQVCEDLRYPPFQVAFVRTCIQMLGSFCIVLHRNYAFVPSVPALRMMVLRGMFDSAVMMLACYALTRLSLGDANTLLFTNPVFVGPLAYFTLGEAYGVLDATASLGCLVGVLMVSQPPVIFKHLGLSPSEDSGGDDILGVSMALIASIGIGIVYVMIRLIGKRASPYAQVFWVGFVGLVSSAVLMLSSETPIWPTSSVDKLKLCAVGLFGLLAQILMSVGMQSVPAGQAALIRNLDIVFSYVWQILFLGDRPSALDVCGAGMIIASLVALNVVRSYRGGGGGGDSSSDSTEDEPGQNIAGSKVGGEGIRNSAEGEWGDGRNCSDDTRLSCGVIVGEAEAPVEEEVQQEDQYQQQQGSWCEEEGMLSEPLLHSHQRQRLSTPTG